jgi:hypothetical protein
MPGRANLRRWLATAGLAAMLIGCSADKLEDGTPLFWPGAGDYQKKIDAFKIKPDEAHKMAAEAAARQSHSALSDKPLLIVGDEYLFGAPGGRGVWLTGFYVHGQSGQVAFRKVDRMVYTGLAGDLLAP